MGEKIEFGVHLAPEGLDFNEMKRCCLAAEESGYSFFTVTDHFQNMTNPDGKTGHPLEAWTLLGGLAAVTSKIKLGTLVSCVYYRHPTILAKMATTLDIIAGGRTIFGVGAGWHQKEFEGFLGKLPPVKERLDALEDALNICKSMFVNERTTYRGKVFSANNTLNSPLPIQRPIPIMVGGFGLKRTLKLAAKYADISHFAFGHFESREIVLQRIDALKKHCKEVGRDYDEITKSMSFSANFNPTQEELEENAKRASVRRNIPLEEARKIIIASTRPEEFLDRIRSYVDLGVTMFLMVIKTERDIRLFAEKVMRKI